MPLTKSFLHHRASDFTPDRDWRFLFGGFLILTIIILSASAYLYRVINSLEIVKSMPPLILFEFIFHNLYYFLFCFLVHNMYNIHRA